MLEQGKKIGGFSMFALWFGAAVSFAEIMTGSLLAPLGWSKGLTAILLGHLIGTLILALVGIIGFQSGKPSLVASRMSLGIYGSYLVSIFNIIQLVGWTAIMLIQGARSMQAVTSQLWGWGSFPLLVVVTGLLVGIWAVYINRGINLINNLAVVLLLGLTALLFKAVVTGSGSPVPVSGTMSFGAALELSIIMPLSWVPLIADYTRSAKSSRASFHGSFLGYFLGSSLMYCTGLLAALYSGTSDPVSILTRMDLGVSVLLLAVLSTVTTTFMDVYSAVMSTLNLKAGLSRNWLITVLTLLGTILAIYFPMEEYEAFLYMIGSVFAPIFTVVIINYFWLKQDWTEAKYNLPSLIAAAVGVGVYYAASSYDLPVGSTLPSMLSTAVVYFALNLGAKRFEQQLGLSPESIKKQVIYSEK